MKNIQAQYQDLLEGKMTKANFMRNVRMGFPQYVSNTTSYEDSVNILKGKRILSEAKKPEGVYGHNPNAEAEVSRGIDHLNYYQVYHGIQYELAKMPEITDETYIAARKKVVDTILKDPDAYKELQLANFRAVKQMDKDLEMKDVKDNNLVDKPNEMKVVKKDVKGNTQDTLEKKEKKKSKDAGIKQMTQTPKKVKGIAKVMEVPGKEKSLNEALNNGVPTIVKTQRHPLPALKNRIILTLSNGKKVSVPDNELEGIYGGNINDLDYYVGQEWDQEPYVNTGTGEVRENKVKALKEHILDEMSKINPEFEHFHVGARVKKKDNSLVGEITEWDGDTATVKTDEGQVHHIQGNILTKADVPTKKETAQTGTTDEWANPTLAERKEEEAKEKKKSLREKVMKAVKEMLYKKGPQAVTASTQQSQNALRQAGYTPVPNTQDVKGL